MNIMLNDHLCCVALAVIVSCLVPLSLSLAQTPAPVAPPSGPPVTMPLKDRHGHASPERSGITHTGGGNTDVAQPKDDTVIITMAGVAVAGPSPCSASSAVLNFELTQCFDIAFADQKVKKATLTVEAQIVGLLRGDKHGGSASVCNGTAAVVSAGVSVFALAIEGHSAGNEENQSINDHRGPARVPIAAGQYSILQTFRISAAHARCLWGKAASAEFAPDPALDPLWISYWEPFHGANKKDFGFKVTYHVEPE